MRTRGDLIARRQLALRRATEESCESFFRTLRRRLPRGWAALRRWEAGEAFTARSAYGVSLPRGGRSHPCVAVVGARMAASDPS